MRFLGLLTLALFAVEPSLVVADGAGTFSPQRLADGTPGTGGALDAPVEWAPRTRRVGFEVERAARDLDPSLQLDVARAVAQHLESVGFRAVELELSATCPSSIACRVAQLEGTGAEAFAQVVLSNEAIGPRVDLVWLSATSTTIVPIVGRASPKARVFDQIAPLFSGPITALRRGAGATDIVVRGLPGGARLALDDRDPLTLPPGGPWSVRVRRAEPEAVVELRAGSLIQRLELRRPLDPTQAIVYVPPVDTSAERGLFGASMLLGVAGLVVAGVGAALEVGRPRVTCIDLGGGCGDALLAGAASTPAPLPVSPVVVGAGLATHGLLAGVEALVRGEASQSVVGFVLDAGVAVATSFALASLTR